jgi:hypothetical protein
MGKGQRGHILVYFSTPTYLPDHHHLCNLRLAPYRKSLAPNSGCWNILDNEDKDEKIVGYIKCSCVCSICSNCGCSTIDIMVVDANKL